MDGHELMDELTRTMKSVTSMHYYEEGPGP
jgi:hypothetical protein